MVAAAIKASVLGIGLSTTVGMEHNPTIATGMLGLNERELQTFQAWLQSLCSGGLQVELGSSRDGLLIESSK